MIHLNGDTLGLPEHQAMNDEKPKPKEPKPEALRIIEEYANDLPETIKKLRRRLN